jgi:hypothetical protein
MVYKIVKTDDYLLVLGKNYKSDSFPYTVAEKLTTGDYQLWQVDNPNDVDEPNQFEILAHLPLNGSPVLKYVALLPPYSRHQEDGLDKKSVDFVREIGGTEQQRLAFKDGYLEAREKFRYTEEDVRKAIEMARPQGFRRSEGYLVKHTDEEIIQSLSQYPTEFETEDVKDYSSTPKKGFELSSFLVPKTITTAQGRQWVGKYK